MGWLAVRGKALNVVGEVGGRALDAFDDATEVWQTDIAPTLEQIDEAKKELNELLEAIGEEGIQFEGVGDFRDLVLQQGALGETMIWLARDVSDIAGGSDDDREKRFPLAGWTPGHDQDFGDVQLAVNFQLKASLALSVKAGEDGAAPNLTVEFAGSLGGKLALSSDALPDFISKASFSFERMAERKITYSGPASAGSARAAGEFSDLFEAMTHSPYDLAGMQTLLADEAVDAVTLTTAGSSKASAGLGLNLPLANQAITTGSLTLSVDIEQDATKSLVSVLSLNADGHVQISAENDWTRSSSRSVALGLKVTIGSGEILKKAAGALDDVSAKGKQVLEKLGEVSDLRKTIEDEAKKALGELIPDGDAATAVTTALFDPESQSGLLLDYLVQRLKKPAALWVDDVAGKVRESALEGLNDTGWAALPVGEQALSELVARALDKVIDGAKTHVDAELKKIVEEHLSGPAEQTEKALRDVGKLIDEVLDVVDDVEEAVKQLKAALAKMLKRVGKVKTALETAAETTLALNYASVSKADDTTHEEFILSFEPGKPGAEAVYADAIQAPRSVVAALMAAPTIPDGVKIDEYTSMARRRRSITNSLKVNLLGFEIVNSVRILSSDAVIYQNGSEVVVAARADAEHMKEFGLIGEKQSVSASYLYRDPQPSLPAGDTAFDKVLKDVVEDGDAFQTPFTLTIKQQDSKSLDPSELRDLLANFEDAEIRQSVRDAVTNAAEAARGRMAGKLKAALIFCLKVNNRQIDALVAADETKTFGLMAEHFWDFYVERNDLREVKSGLDHLVKRSDFSRSERSYEELFYVALQQFSAKQLEAILKGSSMRAKAGMRKLVEVKSAIEDFAGIRTDVKSIRENILDGGDPDERAKTVEAMKKKLSTFAEAGGFIHEEFAVGPLVLIRVIRELCGDNGAAIPDIVVSFKDLETEETRLFSNAIDA
jgi:hypothetical protein